MINDEYTFSESAAKEIADEIRRVKNTPYDSGLDDATKDNATPIALFVLTSTLARDLSASEKEFKATGDFVRWAGDWQTGKFEAADSPPSQTLWYPQAERKYTDGTAVIAPPLTTGDVVIAIWCGRWEIACEWSRHVVAKLKYNYTGGTTSTTTATVQNLGTSAWAADSTYTDEITVIDVIERDWWAEDYVICIPLHSRLVSSSAISAKTDLWIIVEGTMGGFYSPDCQFVEVVDSYPTYDTDFHQYKVSCLSIVWDHINQIFVKDVSAGGKSYTVYFVNEFRDNSNQIIGPFSYGYGQRIWIKRQRYRGSVPDYDQIRWECISPPADVWRFEVTGSVTTGGGAIGKPIFYDGAGHLVTAEPPMIPTLYGGIPLEDPASVASKPTELHSTTDRGAYCLAQYMADTNRWAIVEWEGVASFWGELIDNNLASWQDVYTHIVPKVKAGPGWFIGQNATSTDVVTVLNPASGSTNVYQTRIYSGLPGTRCYVVWDGTQWIIEFMEPNHFLRWGYVTDAPSYDTPTATWTCKVTPCDHYYTNPTTGSKFDCIIPWCSSTVAPLLPSVICWARTEDNTYVALTYPCIPPTPTPSPSTTPSPTPTPTPTPTATPIMMMREQTAEELEAEGIDPNDYSPEEKVKQVMKTPPAVTIKIKSRGCNCGK